LTLDLAIKEVVNALLVAYRRGRITEEGTRIKLKALQALVSKNLGVAGQVEIIDDAFRMALRSDTLTIYDALFIALARKRGLPLFTVDRMQYEEALANGVPASLIQ